MIGTLISNYEIKEKIGEGGMGQVFRAYDRTLERYVAIKMLHRHLTQDEARLQRFHVEAVTLAKLNHPNIALLYNFLEQQGDYYMVMEYVDGETFESLIQRLGALPARQALEMFCQALQGFEHAHTRQIVHRDIKPGNLMLDSSRTVKITDFGIARVLGGNRLTQTGRTIGTPEYMSPEQIQGTEQDARSDIYSLGILLYEMLTGRVPFHSTSEFEIMRAHMEAHPIAPRELIAGLPEEVDRAIHIAMEKNAVARFQSVGEFRRMLEGTLDRLPPEAIVITPALRPTRFVAVATPNPSLPEVKETRLSETPVRNDAPPALTSTRESAIGAAETAADTNRNIERKKTPLALIGVGVACLLAAVGFGYWVAGGGKSAPPVTLAATPPQQNPKDPIQTPPPAQAPAPPQTEGDLDPGSVLQQRTDNRQSRHIATRSPDRLSATQASVSDTVSSRFPGRNVADNKSDTAWKADHGPHGHWLKLDLKRPAIVSKVALREGNLGSRFQLRIKTALVRFSDGSVETLRRSVQNAPLILTISPPRKTKWVKIEFEDSFANSEEHESHYYISEAEVWGISAL